MGICPNCTEILRAEANFCPTCGQENHDLKVPIGHLIYEFVESVFHFDIKVWETLKTLFFSPGKLSKDFNEGKRARYVPPARLYVFVSVVFFALLNFSVDKSFGEFAKTSFEKGQIKFQNISRACILNKELFNIGVRERAVNGIVFSDSSEANIKLFKAGITDSLKTMFDENKTLGNQETRKYIDNALSSGLKDFWLDSIIIVKDSSKFRVKMLVTNEQLTSDSLTGRKWLNDETFMDNASKQLTPDTISIIGSMVVSNVIKLGMSARFEGNSGLSKRLVVLSHKALKYFSLSMFLLMPFVALILKGLYFRRKKFYFEHFIFSVDHHSVAFFWFSLLMILGKVIISPYVTLSFVIAFLAYLLFAMKYHYEQPWFKTILKFFTLIFTYSSIFVLLSGSIIVASLL